MVVGLKFLIIESLNLCFVSKESHGTMEHSGGVGIRGSYRVLPPTASWPSRDRLATVFLLSLSACNSLPSFPAYPSLPAPAQGPLLPSVFWVQVLGLVCIFQHLRVGHGSCHPCSGYNAMQFLGGQDFASTLLQVVILWESSICQGWGQQAHSMGR